MATVTRQPFAPLDGSRLQTLTSLKNRQNALPPSPIKRKASDALDADDFENLDPSLFSKRAKGGADGFFKAGSAVFFKPPSFLLTKSNSTPNLPQDGLFSSPAKPALAAPARPRDYLQPKSPNARVNTAGTVTPRTAPAGRSPTRTSKRIGILSNSRRRFLAPPSFGLGSAAPFSLDAALKGTIPSYGGANLDTSSPSVLAMPSSDLFLACGSSKAASWVFDIHEDTPEQEMTNLLQHSTCTLDISSDDECAQRARRERVEGKENIPPPDDVSQTTTEVRRGARLTAGGMEVEKPRGPLAEMDVADYLPDGVDLNAVVLVPAGEDAGPVEDADADGDGVVFGPPEPAIEDMSGFQQPPPSIAEVMDMAQAATKAVVLQPLEGTGESFDLWESGSATAEGDVAPAEAAVVEAVAAVGA